MIGWLRTASFRTLLLSALGVVALSLAAVAGANVVTASAPPTSSLKAQIKGVKNAPQAAGFVGRVQFQNSLIGSLPMGASADPVLQGGSGRLWVDQNGQIRAELQSEGGGGDAQILINKDGLQIWHAAQNTLYVLPLGKEKAQKKAPQKIRKGQRGQGWINELKKDWNLSAPQPGVLANRPVYTVRAEPKTRMGQIGALAVTWDATYKLPLAVQLWAKDTADPVLSLSATEASYQAPDPGVFQLSVPRDAKRMVWEEQKNKRPAKNMKKVDLTRASLWAGKTLPSSLDGQSFSSAVQGKNILLVAYGKDLNGVMIIVSPVEKVSNNQSMQDLMQTVDLGGVQGKGMFTPLGGMLSWTQNNKVYSLVASKSQSEITALARTVSGL